MKYTSMKVFLFVPRIADPDTRIGVSSHALNLQHPARGGWYDHGFDLRLFQCIHS